MNRLKNSLLEILLMKQILDANKTDEVDRMVANNAFIIQEMKEKVRNEARTELIVKQLIAKFKSIPTEYETKIKELPNKVLEEIGVNIFDMNSIEDLKKYF